MLKKKEYSGILKKTLTRIQVMRLFTELYHPKPAIRLVDRNYRQKAYTDTLVCDQCGERFEVTANSHDNLSEKQSVCPKCGFRIAYQKPYYYSPRLAHIVDDCQKEYAHVFDGEGIKEPSLILFECVTLNEKQYRVLRRFFFELSRGEISGVRMYRCLIIPEEAKDDYAILLDNSNGEITTSRTENPYGWFCTYRHELPNMANYYVHESAVQVAKDKEGEEQQIIRKWCRLLENSIQYYSKEAVTIRSVFGQYPVDPIPEEVQDNAPYAEDHGDYVAMRSFNHDGGFVRETKRWIYSAKNRDSILIADYHGQWTDYSGMEDYAFRDDDFLKVKPVLEQSMVGRMGVYQYMEGIDDVFHFRTTYADFYLNAVLENPIIESLLKVGLEHLIPNVANGEISIRPKEKTLWQKLMLSKSNYQFVLEEKLVAPEVKKLQEINAVDPSVDREAFGKWQEQFTAVDSYYLNSVHDKTGLHLKEMIDYLESVYYTQGCECSDAIQFWNDYLSMFQEYFTRRPKGSEEVYPDSLKKAHDVLSMQSNKWLLQHNAVGNSFREINEKWGNLEYASGDFMIVLPKNSREVVMEGQALHHCVGSYVQRIVNGQCLILFIRRKGKEEKSFFTMEYDLHGRIRQIKGVSNHTIADLSRVDLKLKEKLEQFLMKWGKKHAIDVGLRPMEEVA